MSRVAVIAHAGKTLGGGLDELRRVLEQAGVKHPAWYEVDKSKKAPKCAQRAQAAGAEVIFVWGGDGTVQRCINALAGKGAVLAILPAGTANLLATNLGIPHDITEAVHVGLAGDQRRLDTGSVNGEHFAVMAGAGFDARMIGEADRGLKDRFGRAAYIWTGVKNLKGRRVRATIDVDGKRFYKGPISCALVGNVGKVIGGVQAFDDARPDDGCLELGVVTAKNMRQWTRTLGRVAFGKAENSPFVEMARGRKIRMTFDRRYPYELDGGARTSAKKLRIKVHPGSITICVPAEKAQ
jgi:YegS/Rv2252/BmrU family lipid kinase